MTKVILLGDSIFDNYMYVAEGQSLIDKTRLLKDHWDAELFAVDGAKTQDVYKQIDELPTDYSHLILSCGGNDLLSCFPYLFEDNKLPLIKAIESIVQAKVKFKNEYRKLLLTLMKLEKPLAVCTIYDSIPDMVENSLTFLSVFNDVILKEASRVGLPVIDLRVVCNEDSDYSKASPIEPSETGSIKIINAFHRLLNNMTLIVNNVFFIQKKLRN